MAAAMNLTQQYRVIQCDRNGNPARIPTILYQGPDSDLARKVIAEAGENSQGTTEWLLQAREVGPWSSVASTAPDFRPPTIELDGDPILAENLKNSILIKTPFYNELLKRVGEKAYVSFTQMGPEGTERKIFMPLARYGDFIRGGCRIATEKRA